MAHHEELTAEFGVAAMAPWIPGKGQRATETNDSPSGEGPGASGHRATGPKAGTRRAVREGEGLRAVPPPLHHAGGPRRARTSKQAMPEPSDPPAPNKPPQGLRRTSGSRGPGPVWPEPVRILRTGRPAPLGAGRPGRATRTGSRRPNRGRAPHPTAAIPRTRTPSCVTRRPRRWGRTRKRTARRRGGRLGPGPAGRTVKDEETSDDQKGCRTAKVPTRH